MWVKRTEFEIAGERRRHRRSRLRAAALFGVFVTLMTAFTFGSREIEGRRRFTVPTSEVLSRLPPSLLSALLQRWRFTNSSASGPQ